MANFYTDSLPTILKDEGGYQNLSYDSANYCDGKLIGTKYGISAIGYKGYYGVCPTVEQMKNLTTDQAAAIFKKNYWDKINGDKIKNVSVAQMMMQYIIGSGASQISDIKDIADSVGGKDFLVSDDSNITDQEIDYINSLDQLKFWTALKTWRLKFYDLLVAKNPAKYGPSLNGWKARLNRYTFSETNNLKKK